jgi:hypothetical protein
MSRRVEYLLLPDKVVDSRSIDMSPEEFQKYARERLTGEAKRITRPYDPNHQRVEALRLMDGERELCRVELGDVMGFNAKTHGASSHKIRHRHVEDTRYIPPLTCLRMRATVWTEEDDKEIEYGKWHSYTAKTILAEEHKIRPPQELGEWPRWGDSPPIRLSRKLGSPEFKLGSVWHRYIEYYDVLDFVWSRSYTLSQLENKYYLPNHSSGVYRLFAPNKSIDRCCGKDTSGTLYLGCAGTKRNWSNLRTRISDLVSGKHNAISNVQCNEIVQQLFPPDTLAVHWAYMGKRKTYNAEKNEPAALLGETWLLACYHDTFGEYPPWNQKG